MQDPQPSSSAFPPDLRAFVDAQEWTFARTMPEWPHEYLVRKRVDRRLFERLVVFIRAHGHEAPFYDTVNVYYEEAGRVYWTMGAPVDETTIINRCRSEDTYERRLGGQAPRGVDSCPADGEPPESVGKGSRRCSTARTAGPPCTRRWWVVPRAGPTRGLAWCRSRCGA